MGRKGDSKRKAGKTKSKPFSSGDASGSVSSVVRAVESQLVKPADTGKGLPFHQSGGKTSSDKKKNSRKG